MTLIMFMAVIMALFPVIPYPVVGGVIGRPRAGYRWNRHLGRLYRASILMFMFIRYGFQEWGDRVLYRYNRLGKVTTMFERNAFMTILFTRLIPFIPSIVINVYAALSKVTFASYSIASALGKIPAIAVLDGRRSSDDRPFPHHDNHWGIRRISRDNPAGLSVIRLWPFRKNRGQSFIVAQWMRRDHFVLQMRRSRPFLLEPSPNRLDLSLIHAV